MSDESNRRPFLQQIFDKVIGPDDEIHVMPEHQLADVLDEEHPEDYVVAGGFNPEDEVFVLYRGDLSSLTVPLAWFESREAKSRHPEKFRVGAYGHSIWLGEKVEVGVDSILYEFDANFRRRRKRNRLELDNSLGASIKRLRLAKELNQDDFEPEVKKRTIQRI